MRYTIPAEIKSSTQFGEFLTLEDIRFIAAYWIILFPMGYAVHPTLKFIYYIFNLLMGIVLTRRTGWNPKKRLWHTIWFTASRDSGLYAPIEATNEPIRGMTIADIHGKMEVVHNGKEKGSA